MHKSGTQSALQGERIRDLRLAKEMSQEELGRLVGVKRSAVNKWETGQTQNLKRTTIEKLSEIFGVSPAYIMGMTDIRNAVSYEVRRVPMLGDIAAGQPLLVRESPGEYMVVGGDLHVDFCLRVKGDSMIDARIHDGDLVFVRHQPTVENGEIAVVLIDDEATLKRFYRTDQGVILKPENSRYQPVFYSEDDLHDIRILGKAVAFQSML